MRKAAGRAALIGVMLGGGMLYAGISQAQDIGLTDQAERTAELVAATGGPASPARLIPFAADQAAVDQRADDVAPVDDGAAATDDGDKVASNPAAAPTSVEPAHVALVAQNGHSR